jgi:DNA (cytosine-5)-methyltransferase 1
MVRDRTAWPATTGSALETQEGKVVAYYNDNDPYCAQWLRNLIARELIAPGDVDERSIKEVRVDDLKGYTQCHFFAGIGGWSYALRLARYSDERRVWTGSCPCQPFSRAGRHKGFEDERHLWRDWFKLIEDGNPPVIFGEQTAGTGGYQWLSRVRVDLEASDYAFGGAYLCAAGVSAPHVRKRAYWVGISKKGPQFWSQEPGDNPKIISETRVHNSEVGRSSSFNSWHTFDVVACEDGKRRIEPGTFPLANGVPSRMDKLCAYGNAIVPQVASQFVSATLNCLS